MGNSCASSTMPLIGFLPIATTRPAGKVGEFLGDQKWIATPANVEHPVAIQEKRVSKR